MQKQKSPTFNRKASRSHDNRTAAGAGKHHPGKDGGVQAGTGSASFSGNGLPVLNLRPISRLEAGFLPGKISSKDMPTADRDILAIIDTEDKQLQAIEDLYFILKAQPKYKRLADRQWKKDTPPLEILLWILRKLGTLAKGNRWTVDTFREGKRDRYKFVVFKTYSRLQIHTDDEHIPLDFLPFLLKRDKPLHDMIIDLVALVSRKNNIPLWIEDGDYSAALDNLVSGSETGIRQLDAQRENYSTGVAVQYAQLLTKRRKSVTVESVSKQLAAYNCKSQRQQTVTWWIRTGIFLAKTGGSIVDHSYVPAYLSGYPVSPYRLYKFVWSLHQNDYLKTRAFDQLNLDEEDSGLYLPVMFSTAKPGQRLKDLSEATFPVQLYDFMERGRKMFTTWYRDYFYKDFLNRPIPPAETLLEIFEEADFMQLLKGKK